MLNSELLSKEWCDLVFERRNKAYGAYALRRDAGRRYKLALSILGSIFGIFLLIGVAFGLYVMHVVKDTMQEVETLVKLEPLETRDGHKLKKLSAGRKAVPYMKPGASMASPDITDEMVITAPIGIDGPIEVPPESEILSLKDADSLHNALQKDLPVEGPQLTPTEIVEEMPMFPGGPNALMAYLDANTPYPQACIKARIEGDVEVTFIVDTDGRVYDIKISKKAHPLLDKAALRAVQGMPRWTPGRQHGLPTPVQITLPVHFQLR